MNIKTNITKDSVFLILSGVVIVALLVLVVFQINNINNITEQINNGNQTLEDNKDILEGLKALALVRPELEKAHEILLSQIPQEPKEYNIIEDINNTSIVAGVDLLKIQFGDRIINNSITEMPIELTFKGKYISLIEFLNGFLESKRLFRIDCINVFKGDNLLGEIEAQIKAKAFYK